MPDRRKIKLSYWLMIVFMLLLLGSLGFSVLTFFVLLATGKSSMFMAMSGDGGSEGDHLGQWLMVGASVAIFTFFSLGYIFSLGKRDWRSAGLSQAFIIALFTEMFGIPLTVYAVSGALGGVFKLSHGDHLLARGIARLTGINTDTAVVFTMAISLLILIISFILIFLGWKTIYRARGELTISGIYRYMRHPQYTGIFLFIVAWLVQWPTIITVVLAPALLFTYYRLARREEEELKIQFGSQYISYRQSVPMFIPNILSRRPKNISVLKITEK